MADRGSGILAAVVLFLILSWLTVALRSYVRTRVKRFFGIDDVLALLSLFIFTALCGLLIFGIKVGMGKHFAELSLESYSTGLKVFFICELLYVAVTAIVKLSICVTLLRIVIEPVQIYTLYAVMAITTIFSIFYFFFILFLCRPASFFWEQVLGKTNGSCHSGTAMASATYAHGTLICMVDLTLGTLPIFIVWKLKLNRRNKISVALILAFGSIASIATIARLPNVQSLADRADFLYANAPIAIWSVVEIGISISASAAATLRPLLIRFRIFRSSVDDDNSYSLEHGATSSGGMVMRSMKHGNGYGKRRETRSELEQSESVEKIWNGRGSGEGMEQGNVGAGRNQGSVVAGESYAYQQTPSGRIQKVVEFSTTIAAPAVVYNPP